MIHVSLEVLHNQQYLQACAAPSTFHLHSVPISSPTISPKEKDHAASGSALRIGCKDKERTSAFYADVFGWTIDPGPMGMIDTGSSAGIPGHVAALGHEPHQFTHFYIETADVAASLGEVEAAGGKTVVPPVDIPAGTFAWFSDPEGNTVGLWKPKPHS